MALSRSTTLKLGGVGAFLALEAAVLAMLFLGGDDETPDTTAAPRGNDTGGNNVAVGPQLPKPSATGSPASKPATTAPKPAPTPAAPKPATTSGVQGPQPVAAAPSAKPATSAPAQQGPVVTKPATSPSAAAPKPTPAPAKPTPAPAKPTPAPAKPTTAAPKPAPAPAGPTVTAPQAGGAKRYVVVRGDTLWEITQRQLGPAASADQIARTWQDVYDANRAVIGSNPDLIRPGQTLTIPALR